MVKKYLENLYEKADNLKSLKSLGLSNEILDWVGEICINEENYKAVYTVLFTSLTYKSLNPNQDIRMHQAKMKDGYSGRTFDTNHITPFLKEKRFKGAMSESGWLTRSLEQDAPYNFDYPGAISKKTVKNAFLCLIDCVETQNIKSEFILLSLIKGSLIEQNKNNVIIVNSIKSETDTTIDQIIILLKEHFYYKYKSGRGRSILPVVALYSIYQCIIDELKRFDDKYLDELASHTSSDRSSGATGDIVVRNNTSNSLYEVIEVKFDKPIDSIMIEDAYRKFVKTEIQRYYILSTKSIDDSKLEAIDVIINKIKIEHGCQVIVNGVFETIKYYLRLLSNTNRFIELYVENIQNNSEVKDEHKKVLNDILEQLV